MPQSTSLSDKVSDDSPVPETSAKRRTPPIPASEIVLLEEDGGAGTEGVVHVWLRTNATAESLRVRLDFLGLGPALRATAIIGNRTHIPAHRGVYLRFGKVRLEEVRRILCGYDQEFR